jgi:hypothetical protein
MAKKIKFTIEQARAICAGLNQQRMEKINASRHTDKVDDSLRFQEDFVLHPSPTQYDLTSD